MMPKRKVANRKERRREKWVQDRTAEKEKDCNA